MPAEIDCTAMLIRRTTAHRKKLDMINRREKAGTVSGEGARTWKDREKKKYYEFVKKLMS